MSKIIAWLPSLRRGATALVAGAALMVGGCDGLMDVENPNELTQDDVVKPAASAALVNGTLSSVSRAFADILTAHSTAADELDWVGSRDAWRELAFGDLTNPRNEFTDFSFPLVAEGRWLSDETIEVLSAHDAEGNLVNRDDLARAYLYGALIYTSIGDFFDDFAFSDRQEAAPPVGAENMHQVYTTAIGYLDEAVAIAGSTGNTALRLAALAQRARAQHARAVWQTLNPAGTAPGDPLVSDAGADADAEAALALASENDWRFEFAYSAATVSSNIGAWVNERLEMRPGDPYVNPTDTDKQVESIRLTDPIDGIVDPALSAFLLPWVDSRQYGSLTVVSARELHLILAESALASEPADMAGFTTHINAVRALHPELTPYAAQMDAEELLIHARRVNLYLQGRRLADHYRFGAPAEDWIAGSEALTTPGTFFPITEIERTSNCHLTQEGC